MTFIMDIKNIIKMEGNHSFHLRLWVIACLTLFVCMNLIAQKKIKYGPNLIYEGEVASKKPAGIGKLCFVLNDKKELSDIKYKQLLESTGQRGKAGLINAGNLLQDVVEGNFSDTCITNATVIFASGASFRGNINYRIENKGNTVVYTLLPGGNLNIPGSTVVKGNWRIGYPLIIERSLGSDIKSSNLQIQSRSGLMNSRKSYLADFLPICYIMSLDVVMEICLHSHVIKYSDGTTSMEVWDFAIVGDNGVYNFGNNKGHKLLVSSIGDNPGFKSIYPNGDFIEVSNSGAIKYKLTFDGIIIQNIPQKDATEITYKNGDKAIGDVSIGWQPVPKKIQQWMENEFPSNIAKELQFNNGEYYYADGRSTKVINGKKEEQLIAEKKAAETKALTEREQQVKARAEKEKNTKATAAFLNSAWGKKFNFDGYHDGNRYVHGSSVLRFSYDRSDIWLDVAGHTYHFIVDGVSDDDGKSIRCREIGTAMPGVYISPITRNGKRAFKILFVFAELEYMLY